MMSTEVKNMANYTMSEELILKILSKKKVLSINDIIDNYYKHLRKPKPKFARQSVIGMMNGLEEKLNYLNEPVRLVRSERLGPYPCNWWLEENETRTEKTSKRGA